MKSAVIVLGLSLNFACAEFKNSGAVLEEESSNALPSNTDDLIGNDVVQNVVPVQETFFNINPDIFTAQADGAELQFMASFSSDIDSSAIRYRVEGNLEDNGSISDSGLYTPPSNIESDADIKVIAYLDNGSELRAEAAGKLTPPDIKIEVCEQGDMSYPIKAKVYHLEKNTSSLPDFSTLEKVEEFCMSDIAVSKRKSKYGFPGVTNRLEWFALDITAVLDVPEDGSYTIGVKSDDGSKVFIDGNEILNSDGIGYFDESTTMELSKGLHTLNVQYFQGPHNHLGLELLWVVPNSTAQIVIPQENFFLPEKK